MRRAAERLVGTHDFRGLAGSLEERKTTVRTVTRCDVVETGDEIRLFVTGNGFLYNMVRNIAGTLVEIGRGRWGPRAGRSHPHHMRPRRRRPDRPARRAHAHARLLRPRRPPAVRAPVHCIRVRLY